MRITRIVLGMILGWAVLAAGCGSKKDAPPEANAPLGESKGTTPETPPTTTPPTSRTSTAVWEQDVSKHAIPTTPATGKLGGEPFTPEAMILGDTLTFHVMKDGKMEREITLQFSPTLAKSIANGLKLVVKHDQLGGPDVPMVTTEVVNSKVPLRPAYLTGYAMTLELGKRVGGKEVPGKVYLSLGDETKSYLAGTFTAQWQRNPQQPPEPDEGPFIHGSVALTNSPEMLVRVGYIGIDKGQMVHSDMVGLGMENEGHSARSDQAKPHITMLVAGGLKKPGRYDHTHLTPGRYFVYATVGTSGPAVWQWVNVEANTKAEVNLTLDGSKAGKVEVIVPPGTKDKVSLVPPNEPGHTFPVALVGLMAFGIGLHAEPHSGMALFPKVSPGRYEVFAGNLSGTVTVEAGKTATLTLMPKK